MQCGDLLLCKYAVLVSLYDMISIDMGVSKNRGGPPKSSILIGFSMK